MNQPSFPSLLLGVALLGGMVLAPAAASGKDAKPPAAPASNDSEARSKELLKKHFPLEEDIGPIPVVRVPKADEAKAAAAKVEKEKAEKARIERARQQARAAAVPAAKEPPPPAVATPGTSSVPPTPIAAEPKKKEAVRPEPSQGPALKTEDSQQIDDMLARALTEVEVPAESAAEQPVAAALPPLGMAAIRQTMQTVQPEVKRDCPLGRLGVVLVRVEVTPSGQVASVIPEGKLAKSPPAPCVAERVRRARFPRSAGGTFSYGLTVR